ncbi:hypothetical protein [Methylobacterium gnaphalii]|uniref:Glutamine amidotransferase n=1 Tax=Methylobacterium gnaphalii TaxID=1010610 RepID=A0A512JLX8_9HYPH|nr:hypothetical protein [Methylobacterium gnaphalii]GEP10971.1 hypothetical protein MGN01_28160 [Methylobacterium gnaphalii]GJD69749.1 hypothetical protein MMMDOFMJ_2687 [Methylobacterium gnaphalii]GLS50250.1 hypothetical protein GCM10007885_31020 [Methylobacterium gnaphalii]
MFTLEIDGKAIAVINADEETARDLFTCDGFKEDIGTMTSEGKPLWNGTSELKIRASTKDETDEFEQALAEDDGEGDFEADPHHDKTAATSGEADLDEDDDEEDEADIVFLVDLDDEQEHLDA